MPYVNIHLTGDDQAPTKEQKAALIAGVTDLLATILNKNPATTMVTIAEIPTDNWGVGGISVSERLAKAAKQQA